MTSFGDSSGSGSSEEDIQRIDPSTVEQLYKEHASGIRAFLIGLLRNQELAEEVQQSVFTKALEVGHRVQPSQFRGWLFRVANNEAMLLRRRQGVDRRAMEKVARSVRSEDNQQTTGSVLDRMSSAELSEKVLQSLKEIPAEQQEVVRLRIYEGMKFADIAKQTGAPLNTVLTRMRLALARLSKALPKSATDETLDR